MPPLLLQCQWTYKTNENCPPAYAGRKQTVMYGHFGVFCCLVLVISTNFDLLYLFDLQVYYKLLLFLKYT